MRFKCLLFMTALVASACVVTDDFYTDDYEVTPPAELSFTRTFPGIANFTVRQTTGTTTRNVPLQVANSFFFSKDPSLTATEMVVLLRLYSSSNKLNENLRLFSILKTAPQASDTMDLGASFQGSIVNDNVDIQLLEAGTDPRYQVLQRGFYKGTYKFMKGGNQVAVGTMEGFIDYRGDFVFEFLNYDRAQFFTGNGINSGDTVFVVHSALSAKDASNVAAIDESVVYDATERLLRASFQNLSATDFDSFSFELTEL